jgi:trans-2,3-dihydro-3-hydroxyanthranilate isomerase
VTLAYHVVDVFTDEAFAGNPLAVVLDADDLSTEQMQSIAREFNLSETTFPTRPTVSGADYRLRIFTPTTELPFAGHPSVGTAWVLRSLDRIGSGRVMQECGAGVLPLDIGAAEATLTGGLPTVGEPLDPVPFLAAVGLTVDDLVGTPVRSAGMGLEFVFLHVSDDAVTRSMPELAAIMALDHVGISVFAYDDGRAHARVYAGGSGVLEDPATGSAALGLGVWLVASGLADPDGTTSYVVEQGIEMGRPSRLGCTVDATNGQVVRGTVSGNVVPVAQGTITAP